MLRYLPLLLLCSPALAQTPGPFVPDQTLTAAQLNSVFALKQDYNAGFLKGSNIITAGQLTGTQTADFFWNSVTASGDNLVGANNKRIATFAVTDNLNAGANGFREALVGQVIQNGASSGAAHSTENVYAGVVGLALTSSGDGGTGSTFHGGYYGADFSCTNDNMMGGNLIVCAGANFNVYGYAGSTAAYRFGVSITDGSASPGSVWSSAIAVTAQAAAGQQWGGGYGWDCVLCIGEFLGNGRPGIADDGIFIGTHTESLATFPAAIGIDWSKMRFTTAIIQAEKFYLNGAGNNMTVGQGTPATFQPVNLGTVAVVGLNGAAYSMYTGTTETMRLQSVVGGNYMLNNQTYILADMNATPWAQFRSTGPLLNVIPSAGTGGLFVCIDGSGVLYKKATCP